jgi:uncharacterized protein (TIGR00162 family)
MHDPILIVGLPGIGSVGRLIANHLIKENKAKRFATLYSTHFPAQVIMTKHGGTRLFNNRFYLIKNKNIKRDIIILTGDCQSVTQEGHYIVNDKIVDFFKNELNGKLVYTLGGYNIAKRIKEHPRVFGYATSEKAAESLKAKGVLFGKSRGVIMGSAGLLISFTKEKGIDGVCIMGETLFADVDAAAAKAVLSVLAKQLGITTNMQNLDKLIEKTKKAAHEMQLQLQQMQGAIAAPDQPTIQSGENPKYIR